MQSKKITITNKLGLHARAAVKLINLAGRYQCDIWLQYNNKKINAKDILDVMVLAANYNSEIEIISSGEDEVIALDAVVNLFQDKFGEPE